MSGDDVTIAEFDRQLSRPWLKDLRTDSLVASAGSAIDTYAAVRIADASGVVGELLDLLEAVTDRLRSLSTTTTEEEKCQ